MYRTIDDFLSDWRQESESTVKVLQNLTDASLAQRVTPDGRSIGRLAWHIVVSIAQMAHEAKLATVQGSKDDEAVPGTVAEILEAYRAVARSLTEAVLSEWSDEQLAEMIPMYGESWSKGLTLSILLRHEAHHRAQITVLMRQAGLVVPGCYGPAREEWAVMGMVPMG
jgi:uncharacterized damage-inducible protein DinB